MTAHLLPLLEMKFLHSQSKYGDGNPFSHLAGVGLRGLEGMVGCEPWAAGYVAWAAMLKTP